MEPCPTPQPPGRGSFSQLCQEEPCAPHPGILGGLHLLLRPPTWGVGE